MKVLVIAPHMDDEVLGAGGTICRHVKKGDLVKVCFVCNRAYDHKYVKELIEQEKQNALEAKKILGYQEHLFLDLKDEQLDEKLLNVIVPIERLIQDFKPEVVYLPHHSDNNQDHRTVFEAAMVALRSFSNPSVEQIYSFEVASSSEQAAPFAENVFLPNAYVDITEFIEQKKQALDCYQKEKRDFPHPRSIKAVEVLSMKRGVEANLSFAEAFATVRLIKR